MGGSHPQAAAPPRWAAAPTRRHLTDTVVYGNLAGIFTINQLGLPIKIYR